MATGPGSEVYSAGYGAHTKVLMERAANTHAQFVLPYLKPGMNLLDCGCGPGAITISLAEILSPGEVVGIDISDVQIERAIASAKDKGVSNTRFQVASAYEIPFPDEHFDAVFAHTMLQHLSDPISALREMHRVLKPGGVIGVREEDQGGTVTAPHFPEMIKLLDIYLEFWRQGGGDPYFARRHKEVLRIAGFKDIVASTSTSYRSTPERTKAIADAMRRVILEEEGIADRLMEIGKIDRHALENMVASISEWGNHPDAIRVELMFEAVGWKE